MLGECCLLLDEDGIIVLNAVGDLARSVSATVDSELFPGESDTGSYNDIME